MSVRLNVPCEFTLATEQEFSEPKMRLNTELCDAELLGWNEKMAWDELALYYQHIFAPIVQ